MSSALVQPAHGRRNVGSLDLVQEQLNGPAVSVTMGDNLISFNINAAIADVLTSIANARTSVFPSEDVEMRSDDRARVLRAVSGEIKEADVHQLLDAVRQAVMDAVALQKDVLDITRVKLNRPQARSVVDLVSEEATRKQVQLWLKGVYDRLQTYLFDPKTGLPTLMAVNEHAARALDNGENLAIGTGDLSGMGTFNSGFGATITDRVVETQLMRLAAAIKVLDPQAMVGRRQMMQGDEFVFNLPVGNMSETEPYIVAMQQVLDQPIEFRLTAEDIRVLEARIAAFGGSKNAKERDAASLLKTTLAGKKRLDADKLRPDDAPGTEIYVCSVKIGGRGGIKMMTADDFGDEITSDRIETARSDVQAGLEGQVARSAQYDRNLPNPFAVEDLNGTVSLVYRGDDGNLKQQIAACEVADEVTIG